MTSSTGTSMANMLSGANGYDVRELNGVRFAIRWIAKTDYLEIQAVVVDNNFTKSDVSSLFWDQNIARRSLENSLIPAQSTTWWIMTISTLFYWV